MQPEDRHEPGLTPSETSAPEPAFEKKNQPVNGPMSPVEAIIQSTPQQIPPTPAPTKKNHKMLVISIVTILLVIGVSVGVGVFIMQQNKPKALQSSQTSISESNRVTTDQIDNTINAIEKTLNTLDDSADFTPGDVSDDSLGL